ncbi:hypothetical protein BJG89_05615 [Staphylococcus nepalensis]|jgi:formate C-acetyltransferase|nr:hypothetical protein BJD96_05285 [Staphylococcus nepalensis]ATH64852.1 hypothetical protein BJG89_05615 [Staphylococcus nepalensis]AWI44220.1 hypothetical protein BJG88_05410 [Staphylococcus nepalensis]NWN85942.1 hypothetical protein [Staphylococcus sp.]
MKLWDQVMQLSREVRERGGMWGIDTKVPSTIIVHDAGYLNKGLETIVGVQTEKPYECHQRVAFVWLKHIYVQLKV